MLAAARQDRGWNLLHALYSAQGGENTGWVTEALLRRLAGSVPGLDVDRMVSDMNGVTPALQQAASKGTELGVQGTPTFFVQRPASEPQQLELSALDFTAFRAALEPLLA